MRMARHFFWLGDTHWYFDWSESWSTCNKTGCTSQFKYMVDKRVAQKFTVYQSDIFGNADKYWAPGLIGTQIDPYCILGCTGLSGKDVS